MDRLENLINYKKERDSLNKQIDYYYNVIMVAKVSIEEKQKAFLKYQYLMKEYQRLKELYFKEGKV